MHENNKTRTLVLFTALTLTSGLANASPLVLNRMSSDVSISSPRITSDDGKRLFRLEEWVSVNNRLQ